MKIQVEFEIDVKDLGEWLTCDDPEDYPLVDCGFSIKRKLKEKLGYTDEVEKELEGRAREEANKNPPSCPSDYYQTYYNKLIEFTQEWAIERLKERYPEVYLESN